MEGAAADDAASGALVENFGDGAFSNVCCSGLLAWTVGPPPSEASYCALRTGSQSVSLASVIFASNRTANSLWRPA